MEKKTVERIFTISDNFEENPTKTSYELYNLTNNAVELLIQKKIEELVDLKRTLSDEIESHQIKDYDSYNLGKAHALIEMIEFLRKGLDKEENKNKKKIKEINERWDEGEISWGQLKKDFLVLKDICNQQLGIREKG